MGLPWSPEEFIKQAKKARHPFDDPAKVSDRHKYAIYMNLTIGMQGVREWRRQELAYWTQRAAELQSDGLEFFKKASQLVQPCWGNAPSPQEAMRGP